MQAKNKWKLAAIGLVTAGFAMAGSEAGAMLMNLSKGQVSEAVAHGKKYFDQHPIAFRSNYYYNAGYGYPNALLLTEFLAVSDFIRRAEFQRKYGSQRAHKETPDRIEDRRKQVVGKLQFLVTVYGEKQDFAKTYGFALKAKGKTVQASSVDAPVMAELSGFKGKLLYKAKVIVEFPAAGLDPKGKVALVVAPPAGLGPSGGRNANFELPFDLASMK